MESLRGLFTRMWESGMKTYEEGLQQEVSAMEEFLKGSDKLKTDQRQNTDPLERERPKLRSRHTRVDTYDANNMFIPAWEALYKEKHGKLARVGYFQHVETDRDTYFTRLRASRKAAEEAGEFVPN